MEELHTRADGITCTASSQEETLETKELKMSRYIAQGNQSRLVRYARFYLCSSSLEILLQLSKFDSAGL